MKMNYIHIVEVDEALRKIRIDRVLLDGSKHLFTTIDMPVLEAGAFSDEALKKTALSLGENILFDSPAARNLLNI